MQLKVIGGLILALVIVAAAIGYRVSSGERWVTLPVPGIGARSPSDAPVGGLGVDADGFDPSVRPQDNLYLHVNGRWLRETEIPADRSNYGAFTELADRAEEALQEIIADLAEPPAAGAPPDPDASRIRDIYTSFMDVGTIEALGLTPLAPTLERIDAADDRSDLAGMFGRLQRLGVATPVHLWVNQDARDTSRYAVYFTQGGLGLPDREYYFKSGQRFVEIREAYQAHIARMLALSGTAAEAALTAAAQIMALESRLAEAHWTRVANRDRDAVYNLLDVADVRDLMPGFDWLRLLEEAGLAGLPSMIVRQPSYFRALAQMLDELPPETWRAYLRWQVVNAAAPYLSDEFVQADFDFYGASLRGIDQNRPRWKRGVEVVEDALGDALGRLYVERNFRPEAKARIDALVGNLRAAFARSLDELGWMTPQTRVRAQEKLARFAIKIGYPERWRDYDGLEVRPDALLANVMNARDFEYRRHLAKLGRPVDRDEWFMTPQTVNAYYNPTMNEIVFPAAILQPPFFDVEADDAVNYGAIGAVIGHEFSHGFDDQGRKSDGEGNLVDWWTEEDAEEFGRRAAGLIEQYSAFNPIDELHVNGELTLGENIADLAGLTMAYRAYRLSLESEPPVVAGYSGAQRFFFGWAQVWRRKYRDDELRRRLITDAHAPSEYRVLGVVRNMPEYYEAFEVQPEDGSYLAPADRVQIW